MATNIVQMTDGSGNKQYPVTSAEAVGMPDGSGNLQNYLNKRVTELNISVLYPTQGIGGTNKYDLATAIAQVPAEYRTIVGLNITFINNDTSLSETWKYKGNGFTVTTNWVQIIDRDTLVNFKYIKTVIFELGGLDFSNDEPRNATNRARSNYIDLDNLKGVTFNDDFQYVINIYDTDLKYIKTYTTSWSNIFNKDSVIKNTPTCKYVRFILRRSNDSDLKSELESINTYGYAMVFDLSISDKFETTINNSITAINANKNSIIDLDYKYTPNDIVEEFKTNRCYTGTSVGQTLSEITSYASYKIPCKKGDKFDVYIKGGNNSRSYYVCDSNLEILKVGGNLSLSKFSIEITDDNAAYLITCGIDEIEKSYVVRYNTRFDDITKEIESVSKIAIPQENENIYNYESSKDGYYIGTEGNEIALNGRYILTYSIFKSGDVIYVDEAISGGESSSFVSLWKDDLFVVSLDKGNLGSKAGSVYNLYGYDFDTVKFSVSNKDNIKLRRGYNVPEGYVTKQFNTLKFLTLKNSVSKSILLLGASFAEPNNSWFEMACNTIGYTPINKAIGGTRIAQDAIKLHEGTLWDDIDSFDILAIDHVHNYDVYDALEEKYANYTVQQYDEDTQFWTDVLQMQDKYYAAAYDYILKKYANLCYKQKEDVNSQYYNTLWGKPCMVIVCTHWHDTREKFNNSIVKLQKKWNFKLCDFAANVGFTKYTKHPTTGVQWSLIYCNDDAMGKEELQYTNLKDEQITEYFGWHPIGGNYSPIQQILANVFKNTLLNSNW